MISLPQLLQLSECKHNFQHQGIIFQLETQKNFFFYICNHLGFDNLLMVKTYDIFGEKLAFYLLNPSYTIPVTQISFKYGKSSLYRLDASVHSISV